MVKGEALGELRKKLAPGWNVADEQRLEKEFAFKDFLQALAFTNAVGELAERLNHHPDIHLAWGKVKVTTWTHSAGGLTEKDFDLATRVESLPRPPQA